MRYRVVAWPLFVLLGSALLLFVIYLGVLFVIHELNPDFLAIDSCLDAGGAWDYSRRECVGRRQPGV